MATTQATLPPLQKQLEQQQHVVLALIGHFPNQAVREHLTLASFRLPTSLPVSAAVAACRAAAGCARGASAVASGQRPDRRRLRQQAAAIKSHRTIRHAAALTPAALFTPAPAIWTVGAGATQPIFHGFTLLHQERAARAAYEMADAQYRNTVLTAFQNVADALRALQLDAATLKAQQRAVQRRVRHVRSDARPVSPRRHHLRDLAQRPTKLSAGPACAWCKRKRRAMPTPPRCSRRSAAAGGTASTCCPIP